MDDNDTTSPAPTQHRQRRTLRRSLRIAWRSALNGAGYAAGTGAIGLIYWWLQH